MNFLDNLSKAQIENGAFPLREILENSLYYPSSGIDGGVIKDCNTLERHKRITSFIFSDYLMGEAALTENQDTFQGYHIIATRSLVKADLAPMGWKPKLPPEFNLQEYQRESDKWKPFSSWIVYERDTDRTDQHGPIRFSLLYIGGEGVATYQALYWTNKIAARALAIIQPGTGFGGNWTDFNSESGPLAWVINTNLAGTPDIIYNGGYGQNYNDFGWKNYKQERIISNYYGVSGEVRVYTKK